MSNETAAATIRVTPEVARIVARDAPRDLRLAVARGEHPLPSPRDLLTALYFICSSGDQELRSHAVQTLRQRPAAELRDFAADPASPPQLLHFLAQVRLHDRELLQPLLANGTTPRHTLLLLAERGGRDVMPLLLAAAGERHDDHEFLAALLSNPHLTPEEQGLLAGNAADSATDAAESDPEADATDEEPAGAEESAGEVEEDINASKYQMALEMGVGEKIKMALTGDKEWRTIFLKDPNKLVHGAVLKNPRVTDGEVLAVAKNKASSEELIRIILLNKEWIKSVPIRTALVTHPKTPLPHALRFMSVLTMKDLKILGKSKGVSQVIVNTARRMITEKDKKK